MDVAIGMMLFIFVIANVGGLYFYLSDRKVEHTTEQPLPSFPLYFHPDTHTGCRDDFFFCQPLKEDNRKK